MDLVTLYTIVGFSLASYSVIANDSSPNSWYMDGIKSSTVQVVLHVGSTASFLLLFTIWYGWYINAGDISYGRLNKIPYIPI